MICDSCLAAAGDEFAGYTHDDDFDPEMAAMIAADLGADIPDHVCDEPEACACACAVVRRQPARKARR